MLDAITTQLSPAHRSLADRSITAGAGALFGLVTCSALGAAAGLMPFTPDPTMLLMYGSLVPLSVYLFLKSFSQAQPQLPVLQSLRFVLLFVAGIFMLEAVSANEVVTIGAFSTPSYNFFGFRVIGAALAAGIVFMGVGSGQATQTADHADRKANAHREAVQRLAAIDVATNERLAQDRRDLAAFDKKLREVEVEFDFDDATVPSTEHAFAA